MTQGDDEPDRAARAQRQLGDFMTRLRGIDQREELDAAAGDLLAAFTDIGVRALLLKGPVLSRVLYEPGEQRRYNDVDILVDPAALDRAREAMLGWGYVCMQDQLGVQDGRDALHAEEWTVGSLPVDLHWRLPATDRDVSAEAAWTALYASHQLIDLGTHRVATLSPAGLALHIAIHAAQHGDKHARALDDLDRALARWPHELWSDAAGLAAEIGATSAFASGLRVSSAGRELAQRLALPAPSELSWALPDTLPRGTAHLKAFADAGSLSDRVGVVRRALLPPPRWIRYQYPWVLRWRPLLIPAYAFHLLRAPLWGLRAMRARRREGASG